MAEQFIPKYWRSICCKAPAMAKWSRGISWDYSCMQCAKVLHVADTWIMGRQAGGPVIESNQPDEWTDLLEIME